MCYHLSIRLFLIPSHRAIKIVRNAAIIYRGQSTINAIC